MAKYHQISDTRKPNNIHVGDMIVVESRRKEPWLAELLYKNKRGWWERDFLYGGERQIGKLRWYYFRIDRKGLYEVCGCESRPFRYTFEVRN